MTTSKPVVWTTRSEPADPKEIARVEASWCIRFPADYVELVRTYHGGHPSADVVNLPGGGRTLFNALFGFDRDGPDHIASRWGNCFEYLPIRVFPFADDGPGNLFAFDYRTHPDNPSIIFLDHESWDDEGYFETSPVAGSFGEFISSLQHDPVLEEEVDE